MRLFKMKNEDISTFQYKFDQFLNKIDSYLRNRCPFIYKVCIKCKDYEYYSLRRILSFPMGSLIGYLFYSVIIYRFAFHDQLQNLLKYAIISLVSLSYTVSIEMRAICWLVLPTFSGRTGRSFFIAFLIASLADGPLNNTFRNSRELFKSMSCTFDLAVNHTTEKYKLMFQPMADMMVKIIFDSTLHQNLTHEINETNSRLLDMFKLDKLRNRGQGDRQRSSNRTKLKAQIKSLCDGKFEDALKTCQSTSPALYTPFYVNYNLMLRSAINAVPMDFFCQKDRIIQFKNRFCSKSHLNQNDEEIDERLSNTTELLNEIKTENIKVKPKLIRPDLPFNVTTVEDFKQQIEVVFEQTRQYYKWSIALMNNLIVTMFLLVFFKSKSYHNRYLKSISYDNLYITSYFRRIDARRKKANKLTLLPLKSMEKLDLVNPYSLRLSPEEKSHAKLSTPLLILLLFIISTILYFDLILSDLMYLLNKHLYIEFIQYGRHEFDYEVIGVGFMAQYIRHLFSKFKFKESLYIQTDNKKCIPKAYTTDIEEIKKIWILFALIFILNYTEMYFLRFRRLICGYFYPLRDKKRTLFLYNDRLKKRKGYLRYLTLRVRKLVRNKKLKNDIELVQSYTLGVLNYLNLGFFKKYLIGIVSRFVKNKCIVCDEEVDRIFDRCYERECNLIYCDQCWNECRQQCLACRPAHISDDSDFNQDQV